LRLERSCVQDIQGLRSMKLPVLILIIVAIMLIGIIVVSPGEETVLSEAGSIDAYFCPRERCMEVLLPLIDSAGEIKCAFYELNLPEIESMLREKGADVVIEDSEAIEGFTSHYSPALMHNKFCVFDSEIVWTGSMNPTENDNFRNNNNIIIIRSRSIAENYLDEFEELKRGEHGKGGKVRNTGGQLGGIPVENYFCPEDNCKLQVLQELKAAKSSAYFMTFSFTDEDIANQLYNLWHEGLDVRGVFEKRQESSYSQFSGLSEFSILDRNPGTMHHKVFIIDNATVITGSFNPTKNANERNDENIIIIHDAAIAGKFVEEFEILREADYERVEEGQLKIQEVLYNPDGKDEGNEQIILHNQGDEELDLSYYFISDNSTNTRLSGKIGADGLFSVSPRFSLKNKQGVIILKEGLLPIDKLAWDGRCAKGMRRDGSCIG